MNKEALPPPRGNDRDDSTWAHDQQKHDYYYDDSHGYEIYHPNEDEDELETPVLTEQTKDESSELK